MGLVGFLGGGSPDLDAKRVGAFRQGLSEAGYAEGQNVAFEYRWAEGRYDRFPALATDLVRRQVNVIAALGGTPSALAAKAATTSIPVIFETAVGPVEFGLVESLNRPGGNLTGVTILSVELGAKAAGTGARIGARGHRHGTARQPDHRHRLLLRFRYKRPRRRAADEQRDELAPLALAVCRLMTNSNLLA